MLILRPEQLEVFRAAARRGFAQSMVAHLGVRFPALWAAVGPEQMQTAVRLGLERAAGYGLACRGPVRLYLELMGLLGSHFDQDPQYPWAAEILSDRDAGPEPQRAERLYRRALDYSARVGGPGGALMLNALRNIRAHVSQPPGFGPDEAVPAMLEEIALIWPEKADYVGREALSALICKGAQGARNIRFTSPRGIALVILLMLVFGHGCGADPLYPWIGKTLREGGASDPEATAKRLETRFLDWLTRASGSGQAGEGGLVGQTVPGAPGAGPDAALPCDAIVQEVQVSRESAAHP